MNIFSEVKAPDLLCLFIGLQKSIAQNVSLYVENKIK